MNPDDDDVEVRCVCVDGCYAEGTTFVTKERAKELDALALMEEACPFGDQCSAVDEGQDETEEED